MQQKMQWKSGNHNTSSHNTNWGRVVHSCFVGENVLFQAGKEEGRDDWILVPIKSPSKQYKVDDLIDAMSKAESLYRPKRWV